MLRDNRKAIASRHLLSPKHRLGLTSIEHSVLANGVKYHFPHLSGDTIYSIDRLHIIFIPDAAFAEELRNDEFALCKHITHATTTGISEISNQYHQAYNVRFGSSTMTIKLLKNSPLTPNQ